MPLVTDIMSFGSHIAPREGSYYQNLTAFWKGDIRYHNLTNLTTQAQTNPPFWLKEAEAFVSSANLTNATVLSERLDKWQWSHSTKTSFRFSDKKPSERDIQEKGLSDDIALIHVCRSAFTHTTWRRCVSDPLYRAG